MEGLIISYRASHEGYKPWTANKGHRLVKRRPAVVHGAGRDLEVGYSYIVAH